MTYLIACLIGLASGVFSGLFGVGGGIIMVPAMIYFLKMDPKQAIGTSLLVIIPTALVGTLQHYKLGNVHWKTGLLLAPTAVLAGWCGAWLTRQFDSETLKRAFGAFIIAVGVKLLCFK